LQTIYILLSHNRLKELNVYNVHIFIDSLKYAQAADGINNNKKNKNNNNRISVTSYGPNITVAGDR